MNEFMAYKTAYDYLLKSLTDRWGKFIEEGNNLVNKAQEEPDNVKLLCEIRDVTTKIALMRDIVCFTEQTLERAKQGDI